MVATLTGCGQASGQGGSDQGASGAITSASATLDTPVRIVVRDNTERVPGSPCAASRPLTYIHNGAVLVITDQGGAAVVTQTLPGGIAELANDNPRGDATTWATNCGFVIDGQGLVDGQIYAITIADHPIVDQFRYKASLKQDGQIIIPIPPFDALLADTPTPEETQP